jgi:alpha-ketoglutarate-dependent taurine dioxygenase
MILRNIVDHIVISTAPAAAAEAVVDDDESDAELELLPIEVVRLHPKFGARLSNVDIESIESWPAERWAEVEAAFNEYGVLVLGGQGDDLDPKALSEFAGKFHRADPTEIGLPEAVGPLFGNKPGEGGGGFGGSGVPDHPEIGILGVNAKAMGIQDSTSIGIEWHIDSAPGGGNMRKKLADGTEVKSTVTLGCATVIYCVSAPEEGGETLFAHGGVMYDLLDEETRALAEASMVRYRGRSGASSLSLFSLFFLLFSHFLRNRKA